MQGNRAESVEEILREYKGAALDLVERAVKEYISSYDGGLDDVPPHEHAEGVTSIFQQIIEGTWALSTDPMVRSVSALIDNSPIGSDHERHMVAREILQLFVDEGWVGPNQDRKD